MVSIEINGKKCSLKEIKAIVYKYCLNVKNEIRQIENEVLNSWHDTEMKTGKFRFFFKYIDNL